MTGKWYPCLIKGRTDLPSFILFPHLIYLIYLMYLVYSIYSTLSYQALSTLTGLWVFTQSTKFVETSVSLSQSVGNLGKKERRLLDEMLFHLNFFNTCLLVWFSVALDNLRTLYWIWNIFFHKLSRKPPPHQVANCQWMTTLSSSTSLTLLPRISSMSFIFFMCSLSCTSSSPDISFLCKIYT